MKRNDHFNRCAALYSVIGWLVIGLVLGSGTAIEVIAATPSENFYEWANSAWLKKTTIPADQSRTDNFTELEDLTRKQLRALMEELKQMKVRSRDQSKLVNLYDSFMDMPQRNSKGISPIVGDLTRINELTTHRDVAKLLAYFNTVGIDSPVLFEPLADFKNSNMNLGNIAQGGLGIERDYYLDTDEHSLRQRSLYRSHLLNLFNLASINNAQAAADRVLELEGNLAKIQWSRVQNRDMEKIYNPTSAKTFIKESSDFYGEEIMNVLGVPHDAKLCKMQPDYLKNFGPLFRSTPLAVWQDYLRARVLTTHAGLLSAEFKASLIQYQKDLGLIQEEAELWKQGIEFVADAASMMLGRAYVERYYKQETKAAVTEIVLSIRDTFHSSIEGASWMSVQTRKKALEKLDKMQFKIGYPDQWQDYSPLEIPGTDLTDNYRRAKLYEHNRNMAKIGRSVDRNEWDHSPHEINAFYDPTHNEFVLLAAILNDPFFSEKATVAMKYGRLGFIIGHEIGHGFDDQGSLFDGDGNMLNWWTAADTKAYNVKKQQLIDQANAYEILPGTFLKGEQEIGEIMGDLSGAQIALSAYRKTPGASDQAFFRELAQTWRSRWRDEFLKKVIQGDPHPPSEFRANGIVKQFDEFYREFNINPGDRMYLTPDKRVLMW